MKSLRSMLCAISTVALAASALVACSEIDMFEVNPPADLQDEINAIAEANNAKNSGDTTYVTINTAIAGAEDFSSGWWGAFTDCFEVPANKILHMEFVNHSSRANNWSNWNLLLASTEGHSTDDNSNYSEYFVIRSDNYGWGNADYNSAMLGIDYFDEGKLADWDEFRTQYMDGAYCTIEIDHSVSGYAFVTAVSKNPSYDFAITETYNHPVPATSSVWASLITDNSYFEVKKAYTIPSKITAVEDQDAVSITATGYPAALELGDTDFWGEAVATVTFADGSVTTVGKEDLTFTVIPDLTTVGTKTIVFSYSKTKEGNYGPSVVGYYTINMTNPIVALEPSCNAYLIGGAKYVTLSEGGIKVIATYVDGSKAALASTQYAVEFTDGKFIYEGTPGTYENAYTVSFTTASGNVISAQGSVVIAASSLEAQTSQVGASDFTTGWWVPEGFSRDWKVAPYESQTVSMYVGSDNLGNWHSPCTVLRASDGTEYGVVRMDHFGWGDGYGVAKASSDWNWDTFMGNINGSQVSITVTNNGDNTASVRYHVISADGTVHFQYYDAFAVNSEDLNFANVTEESYLIYD